MYNSINVVDVDIQSIRNYNEAKLVYFISFLLLVSFFTFDLPFDYCNSVFTTVFIIESISKISALGSLRYFKDKIFYFFFMFAALDVELFGKLECSEERPCTGLDKHAHF
ncbi:unnamed protein product [Rotaria sp. Silwood1]|nr:unnamed protein product [Rotaria sp. Silwood1]